MPDFITLTCPACGGKLEITDDIERFACAHCGREHVVKRGGGIVSLAPVVDAIRNVETGVDKTASELAIARLQREIDDLESLSRGLRVSKGISPAGIISNTLIVLGILLVLFGLATIRQNDLSCVVLALFVTGIGLVWRSFRNIMNREEQQALSERLKRIAAEIDKRRAEQEKHRKIVSQ